MSGRTKQDFTCELICLSIQSNTQVTSTVMSTFRSDFLPLTFAGPLEWGADVFHMVAKPGPSITVSRDALSLQRSSQKSSACAPWPGSLHRPTGPDQDTSWLHHLMTCLVHPTSEEQFETLLETLASVETTSRLGLLPSVATQCRDDGRRVCGRHTSSVQRGMKNTFTSAATVFPLGSETSKLTGPGQTTKLWS